MSDHTVYIYRDSSRRCLYVGITKRGHARAEEHAASKWWWEYVDDASYIHVATERAALDLERTLIQTLFPAGNVQHARMPPGGRVPLMSHKQLQALVRGNNVRFITSPVPHEWLVAASSETMMEDPIRLLPLKQRIGAWCEMPYDEKMAMGCVECWRTPRLPQWNGARCPECKAAAAEVDRALLTGGQFVHNGTADVEILPINKGRPLNPAILNP